MFFNFIKKDENIDYNFCSQLKEKDYPKYLMKLFEKEMGYKFNLKKPETINEIIQYLKIYDNTKIKAELTDKTKVNEYVYNILGTREYEKEIYGIFNTFDEIDFDSLPKRFIIKKNNASRVKR